MSTVMLVSYVFLIALAGLIYFNIQDKKKANRRQHQD
jgi:preprotein translocase subunit YajC